MKLPPQIVRIFLSAFSIFSIAGSLSAQTHTRNGLAHDSYAVTFSYGIYFDYSGTIPGEGVTTTPLSSGAQTFSYSFRLDSEVGDLSNPLDSIDTAAFFALGTGTPDFWTSDGTHAFCKFGSSGTHAQQFSYFAQNDGASWEHGRDSTEATGQDLSSVAVTLQITTGDGFRTETAENTIDYSFSALIDYDLDGSVDNTISGTFVDSKWGVNLWLGSEYYYYNAGGDAGATGPDFTVSLSASSPVPEVSWSLVPAILSFIVFTYTRKRSKQTLLNA